MQIIEEGPLKIPAHQSWHPLSDHSTELDHATGAISRPVYFHRMFSIRPDAGKLRG